MTGLSSPHRFPFAGQTLDVLVIGGGIVGAGIARDAALRKLAVGLVEQGDYASGTSSRTSRLLHGGIRYLAQGRLGLVREASREKQIIRQIAPHLALPLAFLFPTHRRTGLPLWKLRVGVKMYDALCGGENFGPSSAYEAAGVLAALPGLSSDDLTGAVRYYDALTCDARLVMDTLRSAAEAGAVCANYSRLVSAERQGRFWACCVEHAPTGEQHWLAARTVLCAAGPWGDRLPQNSVRLRTTKGVHLVIDRTRLPIADAVVLSAEGDRILFAIPWGERVILGTTDTDYDGPLDAPRCEPSDLAYVLEIVAAAFPRAGITAADVISTWAGVRPLVADASGRPSDISRKHVIVESQKHWWDVAGGKLTTYRLMAEQAVDLAASALDRDVPNSITATTPLLPVGANLRGSGLVPPPVDDQLVRYYVDDEAAMHLDDVMVRRSGWWHYHTDRLAIAERAARVMAVELGWDQATRDAELARLNAM